MKVLIKKILVGLLSLIDVFRELAKSYKERKKFKDYVKQDVGSDALWLDTNAFAKIHDIDGHKVLGVFTSDTQTGGAVTLRDEDNFDGVELSKSRGVFYCSVNEVSGGHTNQPLKLDDKLYTVKDASVVQEYMWRIVLESNEE